LVSSWEAGVSNAAEAQREAEANNEFYYQTNNVPDPHGDWTVDVYVNDQWLLQEQFTVSR